MATREESDLSPPGVLRACIRRLARFHHASAPAVHSLAPELCRDRRGSCPGASPQPNGLGPGSVLPCGRGERTRPGRTQWATVEDGALTRHAADACRGKGSPGRSRSVSSGSSWSLPCCCRSLSPAPSWSSLQPRAGRRAVSHGHLVRRRLGRVPRVYRLLLERFGDSACGHPGDGRVLLPERRPAPPVDAGARVASANRPRPRRADADRRSRRGIGQCANRRASMRALSPALWPRSCSSPPGSSRSAYPASPRLASSPAGAEASGDVPNASFACAGVVAASIQPAAGAGRCCRHRRYRCWLRCHCHHHYWHCSASCGLTPNLRRPSLVQPPRPPPAFRGRSGSATRYRPSEPSPLRRCRRHSRRHQRTRARSPAAVADCRRCAILRLKKYC